MKPIFSLIVLIQVRYQRFSMDYVELMNHTLVGNYTTPKHAFKRCNRTQVLKLNNNFEVMAFMNLRSHLTILFLGACRFFPRDVGFLLNQSCKSIGDSNTLHQVSKHYNFELNEYYTFVGCSIQKSIYHYYFFL